MSAFSFEEILMFFKPTYVFDKVGDITPEFLKRKGIHFYFKSSSCK